MANYSFKVFESDLARIDNRISLTRSYTLGLTTLFYNEEKINRFTYVIVFWDEGNKALGLFFTNDRNKKGTTFKIVRDRNGKGAVVSITNLLKANKIDPEVYYGKYKWHKESIEGYGEVYIIDLKARDSIN